MACVYPLITLQQDIWYIVTTINIMVDWNMLLID